MQDIRQIVDDIAFNLKLDQFSEHQFLQTLSKKTSIAAKELIRYGVGFVGFMSLFVLFIFAHNFVYFILSVLYPAYLTAKTTINDDTFSRDGRLYLSYWVCFGFLTIFNQFFGFVLRWIPFSKLVQCLFTVWLYNEKTRGAEFLHKTFLQPLFDKFGGAVKESSERVKETVSEHKISQ